MAVMMLLVAQMAMAQDLQFDQYRKFLMNGQGTKKLAIQTTCTTSTGQTHRIGERGYDLCLAEIKNKNDQKQLRGADGATESTSPSLGTTIHIGN